MNMRKKMTDQRSAITINTASDTVSQDEFLRLPIGLREVDDLYVEQHSRRFLGNKYKLVEFIKRVVQEKCGDWQSLCDIFAGTGVIGAAFNVPRVSITTNDLLKSNFVCLRTFLGVNRDLRPRVTELLTHLNEMQPSKSETNYFSRNFGGTYFSYANAQKIGVVRQEIERIAANEDERSTLLCSLIYAVDRVANTVGHYDAYRKNLDVFNPIRLRIPAVDSKSNRGNKVYCEDANDLIRKIECDVLYVDPPYNSRQYSDAYHLLENLTEWKKPAVHGVAKKMNRTHIKSRYCVNGARDVLADLIQSAKCRHILLSYNNTGDSMNGRSNARISDTDIVDILETKGSVEIFETQHRAFTTGKSVRTRNAERIFYCRVRKDS